jgi:hypothetical protein
MSAALAVASPSAAAAALTSPKQIAAIVRLVNCVPDVQGIFQIGPRHSLKPSPFARCIVRSAWFFKRIGLTLQSQQSAGRLCWCALDATGDPQVVLPKHLSNEWLLFAPSTALPTSAVIVVLAASHLIF